MKKLKHEPLLLLLVIASTLAIAGMWLFAHRQARQTREHRPIVSFPTAGPVLEAHVRELPEQLKEPNEGSGKPGLNTRITLFARVWSKARSIR